MSRLRPGFAAAILATVVGRSTSSPGDGGTTSDTALDPDGGGPAAYVIADWQVRCASSTLGCTPGPSRLITGVDGETANRIECSVTETATTRHVVFRVGSTSGTDVYTLALDATVARAGGPVSSGTVAVEEPDLGLTGSCGPAAPSAAQPCRTTIGFDVDAATGSPRLTAEILCDELPVEGTAGERRSLFQGAGSTAPARVEIFDCAGHTLP